MNDESFYINLGSMTLAMRGKKVLDEKGVECTVSKAKGNLGTGCSWGIYVKNTPREQALNFLRTSGIFGR